jgi:hypothetical protein
MRYGDYHIDLLLRIQDSLHINARNSQEVKQNRNKERKICRISIQDLSLYHDTITFPIIVGCN